VPDDVGLVLDPLLTGGGGGDVPDGEPDPDPVDVDVVDDRPTTPAVDVGSEAPSTVDLTSVEAELHATAVVDDVPATATGTGNVEP